MIAPAPLPETPPSDVEHYIEAMLAELAGMADVRGHRTLAILIRMAAIEAARLHPDKQAQAS